MAYTSEHFENTVRIYNSIGGRVYVIQQAPFQLDVYNDIPGFY